MTTQISDKPRRSPAVDMVLQEVASSASKSAAQIEVKVSEAELGEAAPWGDAKELWEFQVGANQSGQVEVGAKKFVVKLVRGLEAGITPKDFEASVEALVDKSSTWEPRFGGVFSAVFPVFRPSSGEPGGPRSAMWEVCGLAGFELRAGVDN